MTLEDPFFVVKDEVFRALKKTRGLFRRWSDFQSESELITKDEIEWTNTELKNSLRSIEWDLEDLEDTIDIVEKNPSKFKIDNKELTKRKHFIDCTKNEIRSMKEKINMHKGNRDKDRQVRQPLLLENNSPVRMTNMHGGTKYSKLENEIESPQHQFLQRQQMYEVQNQDEQLEAIAGTLGNLKTVSRHIGIELDEQQGMLDEFGTELENTESKLDTTMKKMAKVLRISNEKRQWTAIIVLVLVLIVVIILFFIL
ncbi:syntaxin-6 [Anthonomus grandis grandis]|uniref:syntaxin-6 n=1 Tax=Anthonomus grandis grandis TaxID=2921223 RepID=UPI00216647CD|nr:syntaxin-6 [Anthonomus grandis grandis]